MKMLTDLFSTDYGLMSLVVIAVVAMAMLGFAVYVTTKVYQE